MKDKYLLIKLLKKLRPWLEKRMLDFDQFILILTLKLTIDDRKTSIHETTGKEVDGRKHRKHVIGDVNDSRCV